MAVKRPSVEGIESIRIIREAREKVTFLKNNNWDFQEVPEVFAKDPAADVLAKEIVHIHDGKMMTRIGTLYMGGLGANFDLMGPVPSDSKLRIGSRSILDEVNRKLKSRGLFDIKEFAAYAAAEPVHFYNDTIFYSLEDLVFWALVHDAGVYPSGLEHMARHFAAGNLVHNSVYSPGNPSTSKRKPSLMVSDCLNLTFPSPVVEWMDKPLYGGFTKETIHVETLLTLKPSKVSHPYLPLTVEDKVVINDVNYYLKRFSGITPKEGLRGPGVPEEGIRI